MRARSSPARPVRRRRRSRRSRRQEWALPGVRSISCNCSRIGCEDPRHRARSRVKLRDFLASERIVVPLQASSLEEAGGILLERLASARGVLDAPRLRWRAAEARPEEVVAMGNRAFLMHYRSDAVGQLVLALGVTREPICRVENGSDTQCARIII